MSEDVRASLIDAQFKFWPDTKLIHDPFVWVEEDRKFTRQDEDEQNRVLESHSFLMTNKERQLLRYYASERTMNMIHQRALGTAKTIIRLLTSGIELVFYECGRNDDGTYKYRGARYGLNGPDYVSGIGRP